MTSFAVLCLVALTVRISVFFCALSILPWRVVPLSVRFVLAVGFTVFFIPYVPALRDLSLFDVLLAIEAGRVSATAPVMPRAGVLIVEAGIGLVLAVAAGFAGYAAQTFARWLSAVTFAKHSNRALPEQSAPPVETVVLLLVAALLCASPDFPFLWAFFGRSLFAFPYLESMAGYVQFAVTPQVAELIAHGAKAALAVAFVFALPMFAAALIIDFVHLPWKRYLAQAFQADIAAAVRSVCVLIVLALCLYSIAGDLSQLISESLMPKRAGSVLAQMKVQTAPAPKPADVHPSTGEEPQ
ncbi:MAG TPA: flagellar biosynthetic protein FliR [Oligoflexia bacterium]|nr:flagellar biosynthetic protein FliR [Oligoflexia bacterium]